MMHELSFEKRQSAAELPPEWDALAACIFQRRPFLAHAERYNPCRQRYHLYFENGKLAAGACVYTLSVDLFTFSKIPSPLRMQVVGLPASVSAPGLVFADTAAAETLISHVLKTESGVLVGLNLPQGMRTDPALNLRMLPTVVAELPRGGWSDYLAALRSPYRRRAQGVVADFDNTTSETTDCQSFSKEHYSLYLQIMRRTPSKLETLSLDFFKNLPAEFYLTDYRRSDGHLLGWHICARDGETLFFFFGGHDYATLRPAQSYFNNLFGIVREAMKEGFRFVDFGQTAEIPKMKAGGKILPRRLFIFHKKTLVQWFLNLAGGLIEYRTRLPEIRAFR